MLRTIRDLVSTSREFSLGALIVGAITVFALISFWSPVDPAVVYRAPPDQPPGAQYLFGTNSRGQDMFWQLSFAFRNTLLFGITVAALSRVIAICVGLVSGYVGGWVDRALMFVNDIFVAIPIFPILMLFYFVIGSDIVWWQLALLMACFGWAYDARLIRSIALSLRYREFTRQAVFSGMPASRIMVRDHLPFVMPIVLASVIGNMIWAIGMDITLAVLGFTNLSTPTVGTTLYWANNHSALVAGVWWWVAVPVALIIACFLGLFLLAMSLNEHMDPRNRLQTPGA